MFGILRLFRFLTPGSAGVFAVVLTVLAAATQSAGFVLSADKQRVVDAVVADLMNCRFDHAFAMADSLSRVYPADPLPPLIKLFGIGLRQLDFEADLDSSAFEQAYRATLGRAEALEEREGVSSFSRTMVGFAKATYASRELRQKRYMRAFHFGREGLEILDQARELDSANTDVYLFLGLYDFAKADLKQRLWWILFWYPADRERGIRRLRQCSRTAQFASVAAKLSLADVYVQMEQYGKAKSVASELASDFPASRFVMWAQARYHTARKSYEQAAGVYRRLADSYAKTQVGAYNTLATKYQQARMLMLAGERDRARNLCRAVVEGVADRPGDNRYAQLERDAKKLLQEVKSDG